MRKSVLVLGLILSLGYSNYAQDDDLMDMLEEDEEVVAKPVYATFKATSIINANTNESVKAKTIDFRITHRFGNIAGTAGGGVHTLYGFDAAENIRFSLDYGITDKLMIGFGRSKVKEHLDFSYKYKLLEQMSDNSMPISLNLFSNIAVTPVKDVNEIYETVTDRMSFAHQIILARKFNSALSLEILPTYLHRNMIVKSTNNTNNSSETNDLFSIGFAGRIKLNPRLALVAEYFYTNSEYRQGNLENPYYNHFGVGVEIETGGHVFHLNLTNSSGIILNDFIPNTSDTWSNGGFKFGFNISRVFNAGQHH
jgi:hypothetical protein